MAEKHLYDIYLIKGSGVPIVAGCTGSSYCKAHGHQHELHAGFFSAIISFAREAFQDTQLKMIEFDTIQINIGFNKEHDILIVFVHPTGIRPRKIRKQLKIAEEILLNEYPDLLESIKVESERIESYKDALREKKILPPKKKLKDIASMQLAWEDVLKNLNWAR